MRSKGVIELLLLRVVQVDGLRDLRITPPIMPKSRHARHTAGTIDTDPHLVFLQAFLGRHWIFRLRDSKSSHQQKRA